LHQDFSGSLEDEDDDEHEDDRTEAETKPEVIKLGLDVLAR